MCDCRKRSGLEDAKDIANMARSRSKDLLSAFISRKSYPKQTERQLIRDTSVRIPNHF